MDLFTPPCDMLVVFRNFPFSVAGRADFNLNLAEPHSHPVCIIFINGKDVVCHFGNWNLHSLDDIESHVRSVACAMTIRAGNHADTFSTTRAIVITIPCTNRTTHTNVSLRIDHSIHATNPAAALATTDNRLILMIDANNAERDIIANNPAKIVISIDPAIPRTFMKVLLTISSMSLY